MCVFGGWGAEAGVEAFLSALCINTTHYKQVRQFFFFCEVVIGGMEAF